VTLPGRLVLLGHPVVHSLSPVMHTAALVAANIALTYETLDVSSRDLSRTLEDLALVKGAGNVTAPHKEAAALLLTRLSPTAKRVGAVNTFHTASNGQLVGDNTDVAGFAGLIRTVLGEVPAGACFAVIGSGGAAAAVLATLELWDRCKAIIYPRSLERAELLAARFPNVARVGMLRPGERVIGDIVVNATPIGLDDHELPVPMAAVPRDAVVVDLVYRAGETAWVRAARDGGRIASDGLPMLVEQGAAAFEIWFGLLPDREAMWTAVRKATKRA
jgi:shikimate dehydrogenase